MYVARARQQTQTAGREKVREAGDGARDAANPTGRTISGWREAFDLPSGPGLLPCGRGHRSSADPYSPRPNRFQRRAPSGEHRRSGTTCRARLPGRRRGL
jgi:hypothetical protein